MTYRYRLPWPGKYKASAETEKQARRLCNPYLTLYKSAMARAANYEKRGILAEASWYTRLAGVHAEAAKSFHSLATITEMKPV